MALTFGGWRSRVIVGGVITALLTVFSTLLLWERNDARADISRNGNKLEIIDTKLNVHIREPAHAVAETQLEALKDNLDEIKVSQKETQKQVSQMKIGQEKVLTKLDVLLEER